VICWRHYFEVGIDLGKQREERVMREAARQGRRDRAERATGARGRVSSVAGMVDCWVCSAPNGPHREGCFNCGSLLAAAEGAAGADLERLAVGGDDEPGRVLDARL
jgi:hypothetical protein